MRGCVLGFCQVWEDGTKYFSQVQAGIGQIGEKPNFFPERRKRERFVALITSLIRLYEETPSQGLGIDISGTVIVGGIQFYFLLGPSLSQSS